MDVKAELLAIFKAGESIEKAAQKVDVPQRVAEHMLREALANTPRWELTEGAESIGRTSTLSLQRVERALCLKALYAAGTILDAASLLGTTRHSLKRRIIKHNIRWPRRIGPLETGAE